MRRRLTLMLAAACLAAVPWPVHADAVQALRDFVRDTPAGEAAFRQTVSTPDGARQRTSSGSFAFVRPNRFRFDYAKPYEQQVVSDGERLWVHDPGLEQVTVRRLSQALGQTPAALLTGASLDAGFVLSAQPARDGLRWARATPRDPDGGFRWMEVGFDAQGRPAVIEVLDALGQRTTLALSGFKPLPTLPAERFRFVPPKGADVLEQ